MVKIGELSLDGFAVMAPMAGVADYAVRTLARRFGACLVYGEMASAKGISMHSEKSRELLDLPDSRPSAVQLFGCEPDCMRIAANVAAQYKPDIIDINMGCPAPKITGGNSGSALLKNLPLIPELVKAAKEGAGDIPVTVKIRRGFERDDDVAVKAALLAEEAGAAAITVHGRTRAQMYSPPVDIDCIRRVKEAVNVPVIGNGDIFTAEDAKRMFEHTGCDLVMIGRGALGKPWLFREINALMKGEEIPAPPTLDERIELMCEEIRLLVKDKGDYTGYRESRKHVAWYMSGLRGAAALRRMCGSITSWQDIEEICRVVKEQNAEE